MLLSLVLLERWNVQVLIESTFNRDSWDLESKFVSKYVADLLPRRGGILLFDPQHL